MTLINWLLVQLCFSRLRLKLAVSIPSAFHFPYLWNSHSLLSRGQTTLDLSHLEMQWKWKAWLHSPQAVSQLVCTLSVTWAWQSTHGSIMKFLQIAQLSRLLSNKKRSLEKWPEYNCYRLLRFLQSTYPKPREQQRSISSLRTFSRQQWFPPFLFVQ